MKKKYIRMYTLVNESRNWRKYQLKQIIFKYFNKTKQLNPSSRYCILLKKWLLKNQFSISRQTNVCRRTGMYKRTFNLIGFNRHTIRSLLNTGRIPHLKKLSW